MSRFKELRRIESAIKNNDKAQLEWATSYCKMRIGIAVRKDHQKYWHDILEKVGKSLASLD